MTAAQERIFSAGGVLTADKDPDETLDFTIDWTDRLNDTESISASQWIDVAGELTVAYGLQPFDTHTTTIWLSGGIKGRTYVLTNRITTNEQRILDQTFNVRMITR